MYKVSIRTVTYAVVPSVSTLVDFISFSNYLVAPFYVILIMYNSVENGSAIFYVKDCIQINEFR